MSTILSNPKRFRQVFSADATNVSRDPTLLFAIIMALLPTFIFIVWKDAINTATFDTFGISNIVTWAMPAVITLPAFLVGWVSGFLFLEDRDDATLLAMDVTPVGKTGFISYRASITALITFFITFANCRLFLPNLHLLVTLSVTVMVSLAAVSAAMVLPVVARNKVEGLALTKVTNLFAMVPLLALISSPWRFLGGFMPTFWIGEAMQLANAEAPPIAITCAIGIVLHIALLLFLRSRLSKRIG